MKALIEKRLKYAEQLCQQAGVTLTPVRKAILTLIYTQTAPLTAYELLRLFRGINPKAESMTIYRALDFLQKQHLVHRLVSKNAYAACTTPTELHQAQFLLCEKCNYIEELSVIGLLKAAKKLATVHHFVLSNKPIEITGICKNCIA